MDALSEVFVHDAGGPGYVHFCMKLPRTSVVSRLEVLLWRLVMKTTVYTCKLGSRAFLMTWAKP